MSVDLKDITGNSGNGISNNNINKFLAIKPFLLSAICIIGLYVVSLVVRKIIIKLGKKKKDEEDVRRKKIGNIDIMYRQIAVIAFYLILLFGSAFILSTFYDVHVYGILGLLSIVVFALKSELSNIWCGMIMIINGVYRTGDIVTIKLQNNTVRGRIVAINFFYTKMADVNTGGEIVLSNNLVYHSCISINESEIYDGI